jgi:hypothetical protein
MAACYAPIRGAAEMIVEVEVNGRLDVVGRLGPRRTGAYRADPINHVTTAKRLSARTVPAAPDTEPGVHRAEGVASRARCRMAAKAHSALMLPAPAHVIGRRRCRKVHARFAGALNRSTPTDVIAGFRRSRPVGTVFLSRDG